MSTLLGIDGCPGGWIALSLDTENQNLELIQRAHWNHLPWRRCTLAAADMPVGLTDSGPRECDIAARRMLPAGRKSSVFPPPRRYMLGCETWNTAHRLGLEREGTGISRQAWNITPKIRELDAALLPGDQARIHETHPELVFHFLSGGTPLPSKREAAGEQARLHLLRSADLPDLTPPPRRPPPKTAARNDVIDAAACLLTALRLLRGDARRLPPRPPLDRRGLRMEIWY